MRRLVMLFVLIGCCLSLTGCWFFDAEHNRKQWEYMKMDIRAIHQDLDFLLALDHEPTLVDDHYR